MKQLPKIQQPSLIKKLTISCGEKYPKWETLALLLQHIDRTFSVQQTSGDLIPAKKSKLYHHLQITYHDLPSHGRLCHKFSVRLYSSLQLYDFGERYKDAAHQIL